jgi:serine phosphatase RsbU (regulator of sigma subunit)
MKFLKYTLLIIIIPSLTWNIQIQAQSYADKQYYLVDSLLLEDLSDSDKDLLENSLKQYYQTKSDTQKVNALSVICENMMHDDWTKYNDWVYHFVKEKLKNNTSNSSNIFFKKSLSGCLNNIGYAYEHQGKIEKALDYYHQALKIKEELGLKPGIAICLNNIGIIYVNQGDLELALEYYNKSMAIDKEIGNKSGVSSSLSNIGHIHKSKGDTNKAFECYYTALEIAKELNDISNMANLYNNIGTLYKANEAYTEALKYFYKSLELYKKLEYKRGITTSLINIAVVEFRTGNIKNAEKNGLKSLAVAREMNSPNDIKWATDLLYKVYQKQGKGLDALAMYKLNIQMRDSIINEKTQKATIKRQAKYEYEKQKTIDDAEHDKLLLIEQEEKEKQRIITIVTSLGLLLVVVFLFFVFNQLRVTKKQKILIEQQKKEVEQQKSIVELAHNQLAEKNQEIMDSIIYAKRIQNAILPPDKLVKEYLQESFILYKPKDIVAGDFYWMEQIVPTEKNKEPLILFAAADCTGHGVPGAMVSVVCNNGLNRSVREYGLTEPGEILDKTREIVIQEFEKSEEEVKDGMDIALCSIENNILKYAGANNPLWIIRNGEVLETKANKQPIGRFDREEPYDTHSIELIANDTIYIFSDGYVDQFGGEKGKKLKAKAFREILLSIQNKSMSEQKELIDSAFEDWKGNLEQIDDVCIIGVRI